MTTGLLFKIKKIICDHPSDLCHQCSILHASRFGSHWNIKMSSQFQVMRANHTVGTTDWANAYNLCKQYNNEGGIAGEWRLPTQRELMIIWGLHPQLLGKGGFNAINNSTVNSTYWSSTEDTNSY